MVNARRYRIPKVVPALALLCAGPLLAGETVLYRCTDSAGNPAYTNSTRGYLDCRVVGRYPKPAAASAPVAAEAPNTQAATAESVPNTQIQTLTPRTAAAAAAAGAVSTAPTPGNRVHRGAVYRFKNDGVVHYTNVRPAASTGAETVFTYAIDNCIACEVRSSVDWHNVALRLDEYTTEIKAAAARHAVDEALVRAIIHAESAYRVNARSNKGAQGLMQLMPATAKRFGVGDAYDPAQNIAGGVEYLAFLLRRFDGDITLAAAGYNAGEGAVDRHGGVPPYDETQVYVQRVGILHQRYRSALAAQPRDAGIVIGASH